VADGPLVVVVDQVGGERRRRRVDAERRGPGRPGWDPEGLDVGEERAVGRERGNLAPGGGPAGELADTLDLAGTERKVQGPEVRGQCGGVERLPAGGRLGREPLPSGPS